MKIRLKSRFNDNRLSRGSVSLFLSLSLSLSLSPPPSRLSLYFSISFVRRVVYPRGIRQALGPIRNSLDDTFMPRCNIGEIKKRKKEREGERERDRKKISKRAKGKGGEGKKRRKKEGKSGKTRCGVLCREVSLPFQI